MSSDSGNPQVTVVAVGPGDSRLLTLRGRQVLEAADVVAGFKTVLDVVAPLLGNAELCPMSYRDQEEVLEYAVGEARKGRSFVVCCWGDLNVSARELLARVRKRADIVELVPGISSIQVACARTGIFMEDSLFITLHKRAEPDGDLEELVHYLNDNRRNIILLPRPWDLMPAGIAAKLLEQGIPANRPVSVFQRLTLEDEQQWHGSLEACAAISQEFSDLSILVFPLKAPDAPAGTAEGAAPNNA